MSSPHERDDRFYGYNQDPYTRNPHLDPYTGYQRDTPDITNRAYEIAPQSPEPERSFIDAGDPKDARRRPVDLGVHLSMFAGGVVASAAVIGLLAYLLCAVALASIYNNISPTYWAQHSIAPVPTTQTAATVAGSVAAVLAAAVLLVVLIKTTPAPHIFFLTLGGLAVVAVLLASGLLDVLSGTRPWQSTLGPLVIRLVLGWVAVALIATTGRLTATRASRPY